MVRLAAKVNDDYREILTEMESSGNSVKKLIDDVNKEYFTRGCYLRGEKPFPIFIKPYFVDRDRIEVVRQATDVIMRVLEKVTDLYFTEPDLKDLFELTPEETELVAIDPGYPTKVRITRNDAFLTDEFFKFIEFNTDSPGGPMYSDVEGELLGTIPPLEKLKRKYLFHTDQFIPTVLNTLLEAYRDFGGKKERPFIALVAGDKSATLPEFLLISEWLKKRGYESAYSDPRWLEYDGKVLRTKDGEAIDVMYRRGWLPDWTDHMDDIKPLRKAYREGNICVVNSPRSILASNKSLLGVIQLEEIQSLFTEEERQVIADHVPWTRLVRDRKVEYRGKTVDMLEFIEENQSTLVLKPMNMFGGKGVCVGPAATVSQWRDHIDLALKQKYVIQEYVPIPEEPLPEAAPGLTFVDKKINVNFFAYNGQYAGGMVRTSDDAIINISAGGGLIPIFVVDGEKGA